MPHRNTKSDVRPLLAECHKLLPFDASDLNAVCQAFLPARPLWLRQSWLPKEEPTFAPGCIRIGWQDDALLVFGELTDMDICTRATTLNQRLWELGDVFEIFLRPVKQSSYVEFQIAPNNLRLNLRYPDSNAVAYARDQGSMEPFVISDGTFQSRTWVRPTEGKWLAFARIPMSSVCEKPKALTGARWCFSFGRYDYTCNQVEPVISSTSPHCVADFHRQEEWDTMSFRP